MNDVTLKDIMLFFSMSSSEFAKAWKKMTPEDKAQIRTGLGNGSLNY